jgi:hypothetical protein
MMVTNDDGLAMAIRAAVSSLPEPDSNALLGRIAVAYGLHTATHPHVFGVWGSQHVGVPIPFQCTTVLFVPAPSMPT